MSALQRASAVLVPAFFLAAVLAGVLGSSVAQAEGGTEFVGTILSVDTSSGKFAVKKDGGEAGSPSSPMRRRISVAGPTR